MTITVQGFPSFVQRGVVGGTNPIGTIYINNTSGSTVSGVFGWLDASGNPVPGFSNQPVVLAASSTTACVLPKQLWAGGPYNPYFNDGVNWYEASEAGWPSLNCPYAHRLYTLVGDITVVTGQSNEYNLWAFPSGTPPTANANTKMMVVTTPGGVPTAGTAWQTPTGDGAITLLNNLYTYFGVPQAMVNVAVGGLPLTQDANSAMVSYGLSGTVDYWLNTPSGAAWTAATTTITNAGGDFARVVIGPGESDTIGVTQTDYATDLGQFVTNVRALTSRSYTPVYIVELGKVLVWKEYGGDEGRVRFGQRDAIAAGTDTNTGCYTRDLPTVPPDNLHRTQAGLVTEAQRLAGTITSVEVG